jgi:polysaccharide export outer membrane protein
MIQTIRCDRVDDMRFNRAIALALISISATGLVQAAAPDSTAGAVPAFVPEYKIGIGDQLDIRVWRNEDLSVVVPVRPDGRISVPLAGDLMVGDQTPEAVGKLIADRLANYIRDPNVTVIVTQMGPRYRVRVTGAVEEPSSLAYTQGMTVLDAVLEAGGVTEFANLDKAVLYRASGESLEVELDRILKRGDMKTNYPVGPGDTLTIPERVF